MKGIIMYVDKATSQYAKWLSQDSDLFVKFSGKSTKCTFEKASYLMVVMPIHSKSTQLRNWLVAHEEKLQGKDLFIYVVNATDEETLHIDKYKREYIPENIRTHCELYFLSKHLIYRNFLLAQQPSN